MWNVVGVVVFQRCIVDWRKGVGSICHGYMCILLYMKLIWCNGFPEIYGQLEEGGMGSVCTGICAFFYMWNIVGVVVFHRSLVNWRRGWGSICHGYMWILLYMKLIWCNCFPQIWSIGGGGMGSVCTGVVVFHRSIVNWRRGMGSICHGYMCILLYMKLIWLMVFQKSMLNWRRGWGQSVIGICAFFYMWNLWGLMVLHRCMLNWRSGGGASLP